MEQNTSEALLAMEKMARENIELAQKSKKITLIGSIAIIALFVIFGSVLYGQYADFDIEELQKNITDKAPAMLRPEVNKFRQEISDTLYPKLLEAAGAKTAEQLPKMQAELEKQMVILIGDLEKSFKEKFTGEISKSLQSSMDSGFEKLQLTEEQQKTVDAFVEESVAHVLSDMQPFIEKQSARGTDKLSEVYDSLYKLEDTKLGQYIWPGNREDATIELFKSILGLTIIKLDRDDVRAALRADLQVDLNKIAD
jgi:hypothetical protein